MKHRIYLLKLKKKNLLKWKIKIIPSHLGIKPRTSHSWNHHFTKLDNYRNYSLSVIFSFLSKQ